MAASRLTASDPQDAEDTFLLREYLGVLWARKWSIILITLAGILGAAFFTQRQVPIFTAKIQVLATNPLGQINQAQARPDMVAEQSLVYSQPVSQCATTILKTPELNVLGADLSKACSSESLAKVVPEQGLKKGLRVAVTPDSSILDISHSDPSPERAQQVAQAFALSYIHYNATQAQGQLEALRRPFEQKLAELNKRVAQVNTEITAALEADDLAQLNAATQERSFLDQQVSQINFQLLDLSASKLTRPQIVAPATLPTEPTSPNRALNLAAGFFVALALGIALAFLRERLDDRLRGRGDLEERAGAPVLAVIPTVARWKRRKQPRLITKEEPRSTVSEAYRSLRTSTLFASAQRGLKVLMVCSPVPGEGKTTTAANLAVVLADAKKRVILLSADLRKPRLHEFFGVDNEVGLSAVLAGEIEPWKALRDPGVENLRVMPSGPIPARPAELLQSDRMWELLAQLREVADFVIIDTPPVLLVADASTLAPATDGVLIVADANSTTRGSIAHTRERLEQVDAPIFGAVLNNFDPSAARHYSYGYGYRYGGRYGYRQAEADDNGRGWRRGAAQRAAVGSRREGSRGEGGESS